jgi:hypothetical protein
VNFPSTYKSKLDRVFLPQFLMATDVALTLSMLMQPLDLSKEELRFELGMRLVAEFGSHNIIMTVKEMAISIMSITDITGEMPFSIGII